jgi:poly [ADP-ribose] polymerase
MIKLLEENYKKLKCNISPIKKNSTTWKRLSKYLDTSNNSTWGNKPKIQSIFELERPGELQRFNKHCKNIGNKQLLWHGSGVSNFSGILPIGLKMPNHDCGCFGGGIYFADMFSKSRGYCWGAVDNSLLILLAEVACGNPKEMSTVPCKTPKRNKNQDCVLGLGSSFPDKKNTLKVKGEKYTIPMGPPSKKGDGKSRNIGYDEWIVYNANQVRMRYLIQFTQ